MSLIHARGGKLNQRVQRLDEEPRVGPRFLHVKPVLQQVEHLRLGVAGTDMPVTLFREAEHPPHRRQKRPRFDVRHVENQPTGRLQHAVAFGHKLIVFLKVFEHVDDHDRVECAVRERQFRSRDQLHAPTD